MIGNKMEEKTKELNEELIQALADIESCAWGMPGYSTPEEAADWMHQTATNALSKLYGFIDNLPESDIFAGCSRKKPIAYTNWVHILSIINGDEGLMYADSKNAPVALYIRGQIQ